MFVRRAALLACPLLFLSMPSAEARGPSPGYHPWAGDHVGPRTIDMSEMLAHPERYIQRPAAQPDFHALDGHMAAPTTAAQAPEPGRTPAGWVQRGGVVLPDPVAQGDYEVDPDVAHGMQVIPGNEYPRKHTLFINFNGGMLYSGSDNSAENRSTLAKQGVYPTYAGGEQKALSIIQAVQDDVANYGILVTYLERPPNVVPYTMEMVGGQWSDTNIDSPAGGVAPGADCGALGQRHVVYTFASGGTSATQAANTASQEAGHAWGLDHTFNCNSVMSYCGVGDGWFSDACDGLCEAQCQGPNSAGCRLTHEEFCGEGNDQQNEDAELTWIFGGNEPDMEPPSVEIVSPSDGESFPDMADIDVRSLISDNYGGYSWYYYITRDGMEVADFVDYDRLVDNDYRPALNLGDVPAGVYEITVGTEDHFGNTAEDTVTIYVGTPGGTGTADGTGTDSDTSPPDTAGTSSDASDTSTIPGIDDDDGGGKGCACGMGGSAPAPGGAALLLMGLWARRRRH